MFYDTLCLSSGGIYGISYIGALDYLIEEKLINLNNIKNYVGTSVGAFFLFMILIGYSIKDINQIIINLNFSKFETNIKIEGILENYGINDGSKILYMLKFFLKKKFNIDDITFLELYTNHAKNFVVIGTNFSYGHEEVFNYINTPNMSIITAIRISISVPLIFTPVLYNDNYYVDGALTNMFPINHCNQETTLALNLPYSCSNKINNILDVVLNSFKIVAKSISSKNKCINSDNIINIYINKYSSVDLSIKLESKIDLINTGREHTIKHINNSKIHIKVICSNIINDIINTIISH